MFRIVTVALIVLSLNAYGQTAKLRIEPNIYCNDTSTFNFTLIISKTEGSPYRIVANAKESNEVISIDSLDAGIYKIQLFKDFISEEPVVTKYVTLLPYKSVKVYLDYNLQDDYYDIDTATHLEIVKEKSETQINISYLKNNWLNNPSAIQSNVAIGYTGYYWFAFSKHVGFLPGVGWGVSQQYFHKDTTFINAPQFKKQYEYYTYVDGHIDMKFRISLGNQQNLQFKKLFIDIGAIYNLPVIFKDVARYNDNKKISNGGLHQFTDVRTYVNIVGLHYFMIFCEYRIFDFVIGNYPELPRYNAGVKFRFN